MFRIIDVHTHEVLPGFATPFLIEMGGGKAWVTHGSESGRDMWSSVDYPGAQVPEGAEVRYVRVIHYEECSNISCSFDAGHRGKHSWEQDEDDD